MNADGYIAAIAGTETAQEAADRLSAAGHEATVDGESLVIDGGQATVNKFEGTNQIGDRFYLWCIYDDAGELTLCVPRGPHGSCPPRH